MRSIETYLRFSAHVLMRSLALELLLWRRSPVYPRELFRSHQLYIVVESWRFLIVSAAASPCRRCECTPSYLIPCKLARATARSMARAHHIYVCAQSGALPLSSRSCVRTRYTPHRTRLRSIFPSPRRWPGCLRELIRSHQLYSVVVLWRSTIVSADVSPCRHCRYAPLYLIPCKFTRAMAESMATAH